MKNKFKAFLILISAIIPSISYAQLGKTRDLFDEAGLIITDIIVPLVFVLALLFFFWGVAKYILSVGTEKEEGKKIMVWGVIALFVISSVWGLVRFLQDELIPGESFDTMPIPTIKQ